MKAKTALCVNMPIDSQRPGVGSARTVNPQRWVVFYRLDYVHERGFFGFSCLALRSLEVLGVNLGQLGHSSFYLFSGLGLSRKQSGAPYRCPLILTLVSEKAFVLQIAFSFEFLTGPQMNQSDQVFDQSLARDLTTLTLSRAA